VSHINISIPGEFPDDPNQTNEDSVGCTCSEVRKVSTVSSCLRILLQPCGKHEIGERLNCLASETRSIGPKKQKLLGLKCRVRRFVPLTVSLVKLLALWGVISKKLGWSGGSV